MHGIGLSRSSDLDRRLQATRCAAREKICERSQRGDPCQTPCRSTLQAPRPTPEIVASAATWGWLKGAMLLGHSELPLCPPLVRRGGRGCHRRFGPLQFQTNGNQGHPQVFSTRR